MTREQAVKWLKDLMRDVPMPQYEDALDMAIQALQADGNYIIQSVGDEIRQKNYDLISRQDAMECIEKWRPYMASRLYQFMTEFNELPSAEPKTGHWINDGGIIGCYYCSECNGYVPSYDDAFCKYCGARMVEPQKGAIRNDTCYKTFPRQKKTLHCT